MVNPETHRDAKTLVCESEPETKTCKTSHRNKCNINKTLKHFAKAADILRLDEKFESAMILEVPFVTPHIHCDSVMIFKEVLYVVMLLVIESGLIDSIGNRGN